MMEFMIKKPMSWEDREKFLRSLPKEELNQKAKEDFERGLRRVASASPKPKKT